MWRVAIYAREVPGRAGRSRLHHQVAGLGARVALQPGWCHVATYADRSLGADRADLARLLAEAPGRIDVVVVDGCARLSVNGHELTAILARLRWAGVAVVVLRPSRARRLAKLAANLALADLIGEATH